MKLDAEFFRSAFRAGEWPDWNLAEIAIAGRSNVGKSTLLNAITRRSDLARTSKTPGRTRCLNFFRVHNRFSLVDLPGYGYAKLPHAEAAAISRMMHEYLSSRDNLEALILLIDSRRGPGASDLELVRTIDTRRADLIIVATKSDKLRNSERHAARERFKVLEMEPIICSAVTGVGIDDLRRRIVGSADHRKREANSLFTP